MLVPSPEEIVVLGGALPIGVSAGRQIWWGIPSDLVRGELLPRRIGGAILGRFARLNGVCQEVEVSYPQVIPDC